MIEEEESVFWYENGDMERITTYCVFPPILVDNIPALNVYGQKMYNNFCAESSNNDNNSDEEINLDDFELYYSSL
jgi:hypothetical protein